MADEALRRSCDFAVALVALAFLLPLMAAVALSIWVQDGGPVLFGH